MRGQFFFASTRLPVRIVAHAGEAVVADLLGDVDLGGVGLGGLGLVDHVLDEGVAVDLGFVEVDAPAPVDLARVEVVVSARGRETRS